MFDFALKKIAICSQAEKAQFSSQTSSKKIDFLTIFNFSNSQKNIFCIFSMTIKYKTYLAALKQRHHDTLVCIDST